MSESLIPKPGPALCGEVLLNLRKTNERLCAENKRLCATLEALTKERDELIKTLKAYRDETIEPKEEGCNKTAEDYAREQGVKPVTDISALYGGWPPECVNDGFEEALKQWRATDTELCAELERVTKERDELKEALDRWIANTKPQQALTEEILRLEFELEALRLRVRDDLQSAVSTLNALLNALAASNDEKVCSDEN